MKAQKATCPPATTARTPGCTLAIARAVCQAQLWASAATPAKRLHRYARVPSPTEAVAAIRPSCLLVGIWAAMSRISARSKTALCPVSSITVIVPFSRFSMTLAVPSGVTMWSVDVPLVWLAEIGALLSGVWARATPPPEKATAKARGSASVYAKNFFCVIAFPSIE